MFFLESRGTGSDLEPSLFGVFSTEPAPAIVEPPKTGEE